MIDQESGVEISEETKIANSILIRYGDYLFNKEDHKISAHDVLSEIVALNPNDDSTLTVRLQTMLRDNSDSTISLEEIKSIYNESNSNIEKVSNLSQINLINLTPIGAEFKTLEEIFNSRADDGDPYVTGVEIEKILSDKNRYLLFEDVFIKPIDGNENYDLSHFNLSMIRDCSDQKMSELRDALPKEFKAQNDSKYPETAIQASSEPGERDLVGAYSHYHNTLKRVDDSKRKELIQDELRERGLLRDGQWQMPNNNFTKWLMGAENWLHNTLKQSVINKHNNIKPKFMAKQMSKDFNDVENNIKKVNEHLDYIEKDPDSEKSKKYKSDMKTFDLYAINKGIKDCVVHSEQMDNNDPAKVAVELRLKKIFEEQGSLETKMENHTNSDVKELGKEFAANFKETMKKISHIMASAISKLSSLISGKILPKLNKDSPTHNESAPKNLEESINMLPPPY